MNRKEKMAAGILVLTLAAGVLVDLLEHRVGGRWEGSGKDVRSEVPARSADSTLSARDSSGRNEDEAARAAEREEYGDEGDYEKIDVNRASSDELVLLPGIGPKKAEAIVEWRLRHGRFGCLEDLLEVKGIGEATLERLRPFACVGG